MYWSGSGYSACSQTDIGAISSLNHNKMAVSIWEFSGHLSYHFPRRSFQTSVSPKTHDQHIICSLDTLYVAGAPCKVSLPQGSSILLVCHQSIQGQWGMHLTLESKMIVSHCQVSMLIIFPMSSALCLYNTWCVTFFWMMLSSVRMVYITLFVTESIASTTCFSIIYKPLYNPKHLKMTTLSGNPNATMNETPVPL